MRRTVELNWYKSIRSYEGYTNYIYFDTHNPPLATTGVGNMIDSDTGITSFGLALPWRFKNGNYATESQVLKEYRRLKALGIHNQGGYAYKEHAQLFLDEDAVEWLVLSKTKEFFAVLEKTFPDIEEWPADAQLALMNMAWWMGPYFTQSWPTLIAALRAQDWVRASLNCTTKNPSERNPHNVKRFQNAARVVFLRANPEALYDHAVVVPGMPKVDASVVASANSAVFNQDAKYVQEMLTKAGFYSTTIDGMFGNMSKAAFGSWSKARGLNGVIDKANLTKLSNETFLYTIVA